MKILVRVYLNNQIVNTVPADSKYHAKQIIKKLEQRYNEAFIIKIEVENEAAMG